VCFTYLGPVCLCFGVFSLVCFELSVPVQVIAWKGSSLKWPVMCWAGRKTLLTHSLTRSMNELSPLDSVFRVQHTWVSCPMCIQSIEECCPSMCLSTKFNSGLTRLMMMQPTGWTIWQWHHSWNELLGRLYLLCGIYNVKIWYNESRAYVKLQKNVMSFLEFKIFVVF